MPKLILCCGISGSGKSTFAKEMVKQGWGEVNRDEWRFRLFTEGKQDWSLYKFTKEREKLVSTYCDSTFNGWVMLGLNIIVSNTNLNQKDYDYWKQKAEEAGYEFEVKYFPITLEEAFKRDDKRGALAVGREVLIEQWKKWLEITDYRKYVPDITKPKAIIVDIDGTVALTNGRSHYDYTCVGTDKPRNEIISMINAWVAAEELKVIFLSGRESSCREDTEEWLSNYIDVIPEGLYMRPEGDMRNDRIIKEELFWEHIADNWNVVAAVDDRPRVVRLWHDLGIPNVINVQHAGYEEF